MTPEELDLIRRSQRFKGLIPGEAPPPEEEMLTEEILRETPSPELALGEPREMLTEEILREEPSSALEANYPFERIPSEEEGVLALGEAPDRRPISETEKAKLLAEAKGKMPIREERPELAEESVPQSPKMDEGFLSRLQNAIGGAGAELFSADKAKEGGRADHAQEYLANKNSFGNALARALTGGLAGGSGRGIGEITTAMRTIENGKMREAQMMNLHDPGSKLSHKARELAKSLDRTGSLNISDDTSAGELFKAMPWLEKILLDENRIEAMNFKKGQALLADEHKKKEYMRKLAEMERDDRWKADESADRKKKIGIDEWWKEQEAQRKRDEFDWRKDYQGQDLGLKRNKHELDVLEKDRRFGLDADKFDYDKEYKNRKLELQEMGINSLDEYRKAMIDLKNRALQQKAFAAAQARSADRVRRGKPLGEKAEGTIADLSVTIEAASDLVSKIKNNRNLVGKAASSFQRGLSYIPFVNLNDPEWIKLEGELKSFTKAYLKSIEGGRPSDYDAVTYDKITGNQWNSAEELAELITTLKNKAEASRRWRLESAARNQKDVSGYADMMTSKKPPKQSEVILRLPNGKTGKIPAEKVGEFLKKHPNAEVVK